MYLITLDELKSLLNITNSLRDDQYNTLIPTVDDWINNYLYPGQGNTTVTTKNYVEVRNGTGNPFFRLNSPHVTSVASVTLGLNTLAPKVYEGSNFLYDGQGMLSWSPASSLGLGEFPLGVQNLQINYTAGWDIGDVPRTLKLAAALLINRFAYMLRINPLLKSETLDQYSYTAIENFMTLPQNSDIMTMLNRFQPLAYVW